MRQNYDFNIDKIKDLSQDEINLRKKNLELFIRPVFLIKRMKIGNLLILIQL